MSTAKHVRHVMLDALWRGRMAWLWVSVPLLLVWSGAALGQVSAQMAMAASLIGVFFVGPLMSFTTVAVRETRFLPPTSRELWVAAWMLSTIVAGAFVAAIQALGMVIGSTFGFAQAAPTTSLVFVALCAFAYGGTLLPVAPLVGYTSDAAAERRPRWLWNALPQLTGLVFLAGLVGPWAVWSFLPSSFATLSWGAGSALLFGLIATVAAFVWTPQQLGGTSQAHTQRGARYSSRRGAQFVDRLTGPSRLVLPTLAWAFVGLVASALGTAIVVIAFEPSQSVYESFGALGLLPFSAWGLSGRTIVGTALFAPFIIISSSAGWSTYTRRLRVLPLSAIGTTRLLMITTLLLWGVVWTVLVGIHLVVIGELPATLRPALFMYIVGLSALAETVTRTRRKAGQSYPLSVIVVVLVMGLVDGLGGRLGLPGMAWLHAAAGAGALMAAVLMTYRSLRHSSSSAGMYQPLPPFRV